MTEKMRRRIALALSAVLACLPAIVQAQTAELQKGLAQLFATAEQHNATLRSLETALQTAEAGVITAQAAKLPDITGEAAVSYLGNARLWNRQFGESTATPMPHFGNDFSLAARQVVYGGGGINAGIQLARQGGKLAQLNAEDGKQRVRFLLTGLYLQLHNLRNGQEVYAANAALARQLIEQMHKRREQGISLRNDITRYELQLQQMLLGETTLRDRESIVRKQLFTALGTDTTDIKLLSEAAFDDAAVNVEGEAAWQQAAGTQHVGLQRSSLSVDMSRTKERLVRSDLLPHVALLAENHLDGPITTEVPPINKNINYWFVGVGVSFNFSALYKNRRKLRETRLATSFAADEHAVLRSQVSDEVHEAYVNLGTARTELTVRRKNVQLASENYDVVSRRYEGGLALVTDLTDAASMKLDAELALADARINLIYCLYKLKYACGAM